MEERLHSDFDLRIEEPRCSNPSLEICWIQFLNHLMSNSANLGPAKDGLGICGGEAFPNGALVTSDVSYEFVVLYD